MSDFQTFANVTGGLSGTASEIFTAVTTDALATVLTTGYLSDLTAIVKTDDVFILRHDDDTEDAAAKRCRELNGLDDAIDPAVLAAIDETP